MTGVYTEYLGGGRLGAIVWVQVEWESGGWWWKGVLVRFMIGILGDGRVHCDHFIEDGGAQGKWHWEPDWEWADWTPPCAPRVRYRAAPY